MREQQPASESAEGPFALRRSKNELPNADGAPSNVEKGDSREFLMRVGDTRIFLLCESPQQWGFPGDALVIPTDAGRHRGQFAEALLGFLSEHYPDHYEFVDTNVLSSSIDEPLRPEHPEVFVPPPSKDVPGFMQQLILASAIELGRDGASVAGARTALGAVLRLADQRRIRSLAVPLFGAGKGRMAPMDSAAAAAGVLMGIALPNVREITLLTVDEEAAKELRARCSMQPQSLANDLAIGEDLLDVETEVRALADVLILRETRPPLVVGILGGWGMGKSFVMNLMQERMREVRSWALSPEEAWGNDAAKRSPFVGHVYPIRFDAWTYAKGNLWASLMQTIVFELNRQITLERRLAELQYAPLEEDGIWALLDRMSDAMRATWLENELGRRALKAAVGDGRVDEDALWHQLKQLKDDEHQKLKETEEQLASKRGELAAQQKQLAEKVEGEIERMARWVAWKPLVRDAAQKSGKLYGQFATKVANLTGQERPDGEAPTLGQLVGPQSLWWKIKKARPQERIGFAVAAVLAALAPVIDRVLQGAELPTWVIAAGSALIAVQRTWTQWSAWLEEQHGAYEKQVLEERTRLDALRTEIADKQRAEDEAKAKETNKITISDLESSVQQLEAKAEAQRQRIGLTAGYVSLTEFVQSRLGDGLYEKQLGLLHQVQRDLADLSSSLVVDEKDPHLAKKQSIFPRGVPRIVLFIDDLDRCPPESVVAVLEAAQLLVKSELFVVVIAMDVRFVTRALEKHYAGILVRKGDPCGLDYIEKIIQVPYRVRPIEPTALDRYLRTQMRLKEEASASARVTVGGKGGSVAAPAGAATTMASVKAHRALPPKVLEFTAADHALLTACCRKLDLTPRSLKRLVNVYKLLKIIWYRSTHHVEPVEAARQAVVLLLALGARYPDVLREPLDAVADAAEAGSKESLAAILRKHQLLDQDPLAQREWHEAQQVLKDAGQLSQTLRLDEIGLPTINLVRAFSFVGDAGHDPDDLVTPGRLAERKRTAAARTTA